MEKIILYKKKGRTIGRKIKGLKRLMVMAAVSAGLLLGNLEMPAAKVHAAGSATSVSSDIYHTHTGSSSGGGGCYGKAVYHVHSGNTTGGGTCYQTKVYHAHAGSSSTGGGCYGKAVYHAHSGNTQSGGACYLPIYHTHTNSCKETKTCNMSYQVSSITDVWQQYCYHHQETNHGSAEAVITHSHCGAGKVNKTISYCIACGPHPASHDYEVFKCGLTESSIVSYQLSCGKNTSTVENYALNCGKSTSTVDSYKLSCSKTSQTIDSYQRNCGLAENTPVARLVLVNETAGTQQIVKLSAKIEDLSGGKLNLSGGTYTWYDGSGNVVSQQTTVQVKKNGAYRVVFTPSGENGKLSGLTSSITVQNVYIPTPTPTAKPTAKPTATPTAKPTAKPTATPTAKPTAKPTATPTAKPTAKPTSTPTSKPTAKPTSTPTTTPTAKPTAKPTSKPTAKPTSTPTSKPTAKPTSTPTAKPTAKPTSTPTVKPTMKPTPTVKPTLRPVIGPAFSENASENNQNENAQENGGNGELSQIKPTATPTHTPTPTPTRVPAFEPATVIQSVQDVGKELMQTIMEESEEESEILPTSEPTPVKITESVKEEEEEIWSEPESEVLGEERKEVPKDWKSKFRYFMHKPVVRVLSITTGTFLSAGLLALLFFFMRRTVAVYNDDGTGQMIYLGRCIVIGEANDFSITITPEMEEKACTNRYCIRPGLFLVGRSEAQEMFVHKGKKKIGVYLSKEMMVVL